MANAPICPKCGSARRHDAPGGVCPVCLLEAALVDGAAPANGGTSRVSATSVSRPGRPSTTPGALETLAGSFGPVPRVMLRDTDDDYEGPVIKPATPAVPDAPGRYQIFGEIARGGMGAVFKGRDPDLGRDLAVKVLLEQHSENPDLVRRFVEEAQIGGQLQHPGIVPVYELGTFADARPYFTMKLVKGRTLADLLVERTNLAPELPGFLGIFEHVCQTVAYAYARGVIHRDLRPSNVIVGSFGEVQVMDWGLAKVMPRSGAVNDADAGKVTPRGETIIATARSGGDSDTELSRAGSVMGTPSYMAPEQARGQVETIDERADVFALGSILCEILTGQPAFTGRTSGEIQRKASRGDLADAFKRLDACEADADVVSLARDCLAAEPEDRPRDADKVTERTTSYVTGVQEKLHAAELATVASEARAEEAGKRADVERAKRRLQLALPAAVLLLTTTGGLTSTYLLRQRQARASRVELALKEATLLRDQARQQPEVPERWTAAIDAVKRVELAIHDAQDSAARRAFDNLSREVQAGLDAALADRKLLEKLVDIRSEKIDQSGSTTDHAYIDAFRSAGIDVDKTDPNDAGARISHRPPLVASAIVAALDEWTLARKFNRKKGSNWAALQAIARAADPDPDRNSVRAALLIDDKARRLERLRLSAGGDDAEKWPPSSLVFLGNALDDAGEINARVKILRQASGAYADDARVHLTLGRFLEKVSPPLPEEKIRAYAIARALQPELGHELASALDKYRRADEAEAVWRDLVRRRPANAWHLTSYAQKKGRLAEWKSLLEHAVAAGREAIRLNPHEASSHRLLGVVLWDQGKRDEAIAACRAAVRLKPDDALARKILGDVLRQQGKLDEAVASYREAIRLKPDLANVYLFLAKSLAKQGKPDEAIAEYRGLIKRRPDDVEAQVYFGGFLCDDIHDYRAAEALCRAAIRLKADSAWAHFKLGYILTKQGRSADAIVELREAIRLKPEYAEVHSELGGALEEQGEMGEATNEHRAAFRLQPDNATVRNNLVLALVSGADARQHDPAAALEHARKAVQSQPNNGSFYNTLALAEYRSGQWNASIAASEQSMKMSYGGEAYDWFLLALARCQKGDKDAAHTWFDKAAAWTKGKAPNDSVLRRLWSEAAALLGRPRPDNAKAAQPAEHRETGASSPATPS